MAGFVQIIEFKTSHIDEIRVLGDKFVANRMAEDLDSRVRGTLTADRDRPGYYLNIVEFESYERAMENSARPETDEFAKQLAELCDEPPRFYNLDVVQAFDS